MNHQPYAIVEPNYSLFQDTPIAFGLQAVYKKRFIARAMQEHGIRVFVDLNVASKFYAVNMLGVPKGWSSFCTRGYSDRINYLAFELEIAKRYADGNKLLFVVYGGGQIIQQFCRENGLIYVTPIVSIKKKVKALEAIKDTVVFFGQEIKVHNALPTTDDLFNKQIQHFGMDKIEEKGITS